MTRDPASGFDLMLSEDGDIVTRWRESSEPIRVWVQPQSSESGFSAELISPTHRAFTAWNELAPAFFRLIGDSLVIVRIEVLAKRVDGLHAAFAQRLEELAVNQLDAAAIRLGAARRSDHPVSPSGIVNCDS